MSESDLHRISGSCRKTVRELRILQGTVSNESPETENPVTRGEPPPSGPADWSILNRPLPDLFQLPPLASHLETDDEPTIGSLGIPAADLERLRSTAIFPEDSARLLYAVALGYLFQAEITDDAILSMLDGLALICGSARPSVTSISSENVSSTSIYSEMELGELVSLSVPFFCGQVLFGTKGEVASAVSWGVVAAVTERTVIERLGYSVAAFRAIEYLWQLKDTAVSLQKAALAGIPATAYGECHHLMDAYLLSFRSRQAPPRNVADTRDRDFRMLKARLQNVDGKRLTLAELGRREHLSREGVRLIEKKGMTVLREPENLEHLGFLWFWLDRLLSAGGGVLCAGELARQLHDALGWTVIPCDEDLASLVGLSPRYQVDTGAPFWVTLSRQRCVNCPGIRSALSGAVEAGPEGTLGFGEACEALREFCQGRRCPEFKKVIRFSPDMLLFLADSTDGISTRRGYLHAEAIQVSPSKDINILMEEIVRAAENGIHIKDVRRQLNRTALAGSAMQHFTYKRLYTSQSFLQCGPATFIHRERVSIPKRLLAEIEEDILLRLNSHDIPYFCINGIIFEKYRGRLIANNITNATTLYSYLRAFGSGTLSFVEYPFLLKKDGGRRRPALPVVLEEYLLKQGGPVSKAQIKRFSIEALGVSEALCLGYLRGARNLLRLDREHFIHTATLRVEKTDLAPITDSMKEFRGKGPVTAEWLFDSQEEACRKLGITGPKFLHSVIRHFFPGKFRILCRRLA